MDEELNADSPSSSNNNLDYLSQAMARQQQPIPQSKYQQLLAILEEMGKDIRGAYAGSKTSSERLKRGIVHARILVRECLAETERAARQ